MATPCNTGCSPGCANDSTLRCPYKYDAFCVTYKGDALPCMNVVKGENLESLLGKFCGSVDGIGVDLLQVDDNIEAAELSINTTLSTTNLTSQDDRLDTILSTFCDRVRACVIAASLESS